MAARFPSRSAAETSRAVVDLVRSSGAVSRTELAERSGLTGASISRTVKRLLDDGLLVGVGQADSTGGKRRTLLALNAAGRFAVGVAVDVAQVTHVLIDLRGDVVGRLASPGVGSDDPRVATLRLAAEAVGLLARHGVDPGDVSGIGVAIAGRLDARGTAMRASRESAEWEQFDLGAALAEATGLPVTLEHDYVCAALGEFWVGRIPTTDDFVCFYAATGFGAGIVLGGEVYRGASANAGEVGHMVLALDGPRCWCGGRGCLEAFAGPRTVVGRALADPALAARLGLSGDPELLREDFGAVAAAAVAGDARCLPLLEDSARHVAAAVLSLTNVLDLDRVVLSGPAIAQAGPVYLRAAREAVESLSFVRQVHPVAVELSQLGLESAAIGAATVALDANLLPAARPAAGADRADREAVGARRLVLSGGAG